MSGVTHRIVVRVKTLARFEAVADVFLLCYTVGEDALGEEAEVDCKGEGPGACDGCRG